MKIFKNCLEYISKRKFRFLDHLRVKDKRKVISTWCESCSHFQSTSRLTRMFECRIRAKKKKKYLGKGEGKIARVCDSESHAIRLVSWLLSILQRCPVAYLTRLVAFLLALNFPTNFLLKASKILQN